MTGVDLWMAIANAQAAADGLEAQFRAVRNGQDLAGCFLRVSAALAGAMEDLEDHGMAPGEAGRG